MIGHGSFLKILLEGVQTLSLSCPDPGGGGTRPNHPGSLAHSEMAVNMKGQAMQSTLTPRKDGYDLLDVEK